MQSYETFWCFRHFSAVCDFMKILWFDPCGSGSENKAPPPNDQIAVLKLGHRVLHYGGDTMKGGGIGEGKGKPAGRRGRRRRGTVPRELCDADAWVSGEGLILEFVTLKLWDILPEIFPFLNSEICLRRIFSQLQNKIRWIGMKPLARYRLDAYGSTPPGEERGDPPPGGFPTLKRWWDGGTCQFD